MSAAGIMEPETTKTKMRQVKEVIDPSLCIPGRAPAPGDPDLPPAARSVHKSALENGWSVEVIYAQGITTTPRLVHMYTLRMARGGQGVVGVWTADARSGKMSWSFGYAGIKGVWLLGSAGGVDAQEIAFSLNATEMKAVIKAEPMTRKLISNSQYDSILSEHKDSLFIPEREFRAPYKKAPRAKKGEA